VVVCYNNCLLLRIGFLWTQYPLDYSNFRGLTDKVKKNMEFFLQKFFLHGTPEQIYAKNRPKHTKILQKNIKKVSFFKKFQIV